VLSVSEQQAMKVFWSYDMANVKLVTRKKVIPTISDQNKYHKSNDKTFVLYRFIAIFTVAASFFTN